MKRTVLTTGANSGSGLATALELARQGFRSVAGVRSAAKAEVVREAAAAAGIAVETVLLDVTDAERSARVIDDLRPFGLVNNAGYGTMGAIEDVGDEAIMGDPADVARVIASALTARLPAPATWSVSTLTPILRRPVDADAAQGLSLARRARL